MIYDEEAKSDMRSYRERMKKAHDLTLSQGVQIQGTGNFVLFLKLPIELRQLVYQYLFLSNHVLVSSKNHQCSAYKPEDRDDTDTFGDVNALRPEDSPNFTAILRTSKQLHEEALPIFYETATLHFPMAVGGDLCLKQHPGHVQKAWNVSVAYSYTSSEPLYPWVGVERQEIFNDNLSHDNETMDRCIAACLNMVAANCKNARNIILHLIGGECCHEHGREGYDGIASALEYMADTSGCRTAAACMNLAGGEMFRCMAVVHFETDVKLEDVIFNGIMVAKGCGKGPGDRFEWFEKDPGISWPIIKLRRKQINQIDALALNSFILGRCEESVRVWLLTTRPSEA